MNVLHYFPASNEKTRFQSFFMSTTVQPRAAMDKQSKAGPRAAGGPLQHLQIAVRVAKRSDGPASNVHVDTHRLANVIVHKIQLWEPF